MNMAKIEVKGTSITVVSGSVDDYISLTDIACYKDSFTLTPKRWILDWPHRARLSPAGCVSRALRGRVNAVGHLPAG